MASNTGPAPAPAGEIIPIPVSTILSNWRSLHRRGAIHHPTRESLVSQVTPQTVAAVERDDLTRDPGSFVQTQHRHGVAAVLHRGHALPAPRGYRVLVLNRKLKVRPHIEHTGSHQPRTQAIDDDSGRRQLIREVTCQ